MKGVMNVMDRTGHTAVPWTDDKLSQDHVNAEFDRLVSQGHLAFAEVETSPGRKENVRISKIDLEKHENVTMVPPFVGG